MSITSSPVRDIGQLAPLELFYCLQADDEISEQDEEESENFTDYILSEEEDMSNENSQTAQQIGWFSG